MTTRKKAPSAKNPSSKKTKPQEVGPQSIVRIDMTMEELEANCQLLNMALQTKGVQVAQPVMHLIIKFQQAVKEQHGVDVSTG